MVTLRGGQAEIGRGRGLSPQFPPSTVNQIVWIDRIHTQTPWLEIILKGARDTDLTNLTNTVIRIPG